MSVSVSELKDHLSATLNRAAFGGERIIIESRGKPKVAVISIEDLEWLEDLEDARALQEARAEYDASKGVLREPRAGYEDQEGPVSLEELKAELGLE
jgi:prevent-host-death family protein